MQDAGDGAEGEGDVRAHRDARRDDDASDVLLV